MSAAKTLNTNPLLDKELIKAFIDGVKRTLLNMASTEVKLKDPFVTQKFESRGNIAGVIGMVSGNLKGTMSISFQTPVVLEIMKNMLGEEYTEINAEVEDAVGELTNMVYGAAKATLNKMNYNFEMAIPTVISGTYKITTMHSGATLVVPFEISSGEFYIEITVQ